MSSGSSGSGERIGRTTRDAIFRLESALAVAFPARARLLNEHAEASEELVKIRRELLLLEKKGGGEGGGDSKEVERENAKLDAALNELADARRRVDAARLEMMGAAGAGGGEDAASSMSVRRARTLLTQSESIRRRAVAIRGKTAGIAAETREVEEAARRAGMMAAGAGKGGASSSSAARGSAKRKQVLELAAARRRAAAAAHGVEGWTREEIVRRMAAATEELRLATRERAAAEETLRLARMRLKESHEAEAAVLGNFEECVRAAEELDAEGVFGALLFPTAATAPAIAPAIAPATTAATSTPLQGGTSERGGDPSLPGPAAAAATAGNQRKGQRL